MHEWLKLPGLFYRHELEQVVQVDGTHEYRFDPAGHDDRGRELIAVYCRGPRAPRCSAEIDVRRREARQAASPEGGLA